MVVQLNIINGNHRVLFLDYNISFITRIWFNNLYNELLRMYCNKNNSEDCVFSFAFKSHEIINNEKSQRRWEQYLWVSNKTITTNNKYKP